MLQRRVSDEVVVYVSPLLARLGVPHGFSTRLGGVSEAPFDSMNLGNPSGCAVQDSNSHIEENYRRLQRAIGAGERRRCWVHQVHGAGVVDADGERYEPGEKGDAIVSGDASKILSVRTADCVPILLAGAGGAVVAAVHAGWRGVVAEVLPATIAAMRERGAGDVAAAIGPCIGFDSFEVGGEVLAEFESQFRGAAPIRRDDGGKGRVDLRRACQIQLEAAGVLADWIDVSDRCTFRDHEEFFSHRRDQGITGRMAALIGPVAGSPRKLQ